LPSEGASIIKPIKGGALGDAAHSSVSSWTGRTPGTWRTKRRKEDHRSRIATTQCKVTQKHRRPLPPSRSRPLEIPLPSLPVSANPRTARTCRRKKIQFELIAKSTPKCFRVLEFAVYLSCGPDARLIFPPTGIRPKANVSFRLFSPIREIKTRRGNAADANHARQTNKAWKTKFRMK